jgi:glycyl-tRNA synthetase beta subunit
MKHTTEISGYRKLSNGQFVIDITCCGTHHHPHTVAASAVDTPEKRDASIAAACELAKQNHESEIKAEQHLIDAVGSTTEHP